MINAQIVADSINDKNGARLTTFVLTYPRFIHAQIMTHRVFSRNVSSSRAIPVSKMIESIEKDPAYPISWGSNIKGMQAGNELSSEQIGYLRLVWNMARDNAIHAALAASKIGLHKQHVNRLLEPFAHVNTILTGTDFDNFFALRISDHAQPEIHELALQMKRAMDSKTPVLCEPLDWHLPFVLDEEQNNDLMDKIISSSARCARVSYKSNVTGWNSTLDEDKVLYDRLLKEKHMSPFEHQAFCLGENKYIKNFRGWRQYRDVVENGI